MNPKKSFILILCFLLLFKSTLSGPGFPLWASFCAAGCASALFFYGLCMTGCLAACSPTCFEANQMI